MSLSASRIAILLAAFFVSFSAYFIHLKALQNFWYWRYPLADITIHLLIGFAVGLAVSIFIKRSPLRKSVLLVLAISVIWEIFEYATGTTFTSSGLWSDTAGDILFALLGGAMAVRLSGLFGRLVHG